jgi:hypothetical protein
MQGASRAATLRKGMVDRKDTCGDGGRGKDADDELDNAMTASPSHVAKGREKVSPLIGMSIKLDRDERRSSLGQMLTWVNPRTVRSEYA